MNYLLIIYANEAARADVPPAAQQEEMGKWFAYTEEMKSAGVFVAGDALQPTSTATSVRLRDGKIVHTDGPFAETKEQLGGYYLMNCKDLDHALEWAGKCPGAANGTLEVRPVMVFE